MSGSDNPGDGGGEGEGDTEGGWMMHPSTYEALKLLFSKYWEDFDETNCTWGE